MSKPVKWIIGIVLFLAALIIIIPLSLPLFINPNDYKETIARKVREQTGRTLSIPGRIDLDFSLIGLNTVFKMGEVKLSSSSEFPDTEFFASRNVEVDLALWPLIRDKELKVNRIRLDGVNVNLVKNEQGVGSWEDLAGGQQAGPPAEKQEPKAGAEGTGLAAIDIGGIQARDINVTYADRQAGSMFKLSNLYLDIGRIRQGHPFPFKANFELLAQNREQQPLSANINAASEITFSLPDKHYALDGFVMEGLVKNSSLPAGGLDFDVAADIDLDMRQQKVDIKKLIINRGDMEIKTMLSVAGLADPQISGSLRMPPFSPRKQADALGITLPVEDPQSLASLSAEVDFSGNLQEMQLKKINLNLDETKIDGTITVKDLMQPAYDLSLHIDQLDLDRYTAGKKAEQPADESPAAEEPVPAPPSAPQAQEKTDHVILPVEQLRKLNFHADLKIDRLKAAKLAVTNIRLKAGGRDGLIKLEPLAADFYDGAINLTAEIDARQDTPVVMAVNDLKGVQLEPMFMDLAGKAEIKGRADIHANITGRGKTRDELNRSANGRVNLSLADGEIARLKIIDTIRTAKALLGSTKKDEEPAAQEPPPAKTSAPGRSTTFASLTASGVITNGVFTNDDLFAESELMKVEGGGTVDLVNETIDYLLTIYLAKTIDRNEETGLVDLAETPIPYRVKGTFDNIQQSAALGEIVKSEAKKFLFKEIEKQLSDDEEKEGAEKEPSDSPQDLINKGLKSIFGK